MEIENFLASTFAAEHPADAAQVLEGLAPEDASAFIDVLPYRVAAEVLLKMVASNAADCLTRISSARCAQIIAALPLDRAATLLRQLDPTAQQKLLSQSPSDIGALLGRLLRYPENSAGALMDPRVLALPEDITAGEALARLRRAPRHVLYYLYTVNREQQLVGVVNLRVLMLAPPRQLLSASMRREVATVPVLAGCLAIVEHPGWRNVHALPVVDPNGIFLGVLRYETLRQLERASTAPQAASGLAAVLTVSELCWVGLAGVLSDLTAAARTSMRAGKETEHE